jgi:hypothetical protein
MWVFLFDSNTFLKNTNKTRTRVKLGYMQEVMTTDELTCKR